PMRRILFVFFLALAGCASPRYDIDFEYDTAANFAALKTYDWQPPTGGAVNDEVLANRIRGTVDTALQKRGFTQSPEPDFLIAMRLSSQPRPSGASTGVGMSFGFPMGRSGRMSVGGSTRRPIDVKEGQLVLDFIDPKARSLLWRATAVASGRPGTPS